MSIDIERLERDLQYWYDIAPEGATHYQPTHQVFYKATKGGPWKHLASLPGRTQPWRSFPGTVDVSCLIKRPVEWDGIGLPPVGVECEMAYTINVAVDDLSLFFPAPEGTKVKIAGSAYYGNGPVAVFEGRLENGDWFYGFHKGSAFRPIRTPEQRERDKAVERAMEKAMFDCSASEAKAIAEFARNLYDAGMLK